MIDFLQMNKNLGEILNTLATECISRRLHYLYAAKTVRSSELACIFEDYAQERETYIRQLDRIAASLDMALHATHDVSSFLPNYQQIHQSAQGNKSDLDWLNDCLEQETRTLGIYEKALNQRLPIHIYGFVGDQCLNIRRACDSLEQMILSYHYWTA